MSKTLWLPKTLSSELAAYNLLPADLVLYINSTCNLRCRHCYIGDQLLSASNRLATESVIFFLKSLDTLARITVLGGEPLLHPGIRAIIRACGDLGIEERRLTTNLMFLDRLDLNELKAARFRICVSLDGHTAELHEQIRGQGTYEPVVRNIEKLLSEGIDVEITHTVTRATLPHLLAFVDFCKKIGVRRLNLHKVSPRGNAEANRDLDVEPSQWVAAIELLESRIRKPGPDCLFVRYERLFVSREEFRSLVKSGEYHHHGNGSFYAADGGRRLVIYPDGKFYVSSEAFGTDSFIGELRGGRFVYNSQSANEIEMTDSLGEDFRVWMINDLLQGDQRYPEVLSVSYRRSLYV